MSTPERTWRSRAARIARKANAGWYLQAITPLLVGGSVIFAAAVLGLRTLRPGLFDPVWLGIAGGVLLLSVLLAGFFLAKRRFIDAREGLVRLEDRLVLHNALSCADRGVGEWPDPALDPDDLRRAGLNWNAPVAFFPLLTCLLLIAAAVLVPIPALNAATERLPPNEPGAWEQMTEWLDELEEENLFEESTIEEAREKIEELRNQPEEEWFSHSSMEATDSMREAMERDLREAAQDLETLERDLAALENFSGEMSEKAREMLMEEYVEALKNLGLNEMKLDSSLLEQLEGLDLSKISKGRMDQLTREQMQELRERLKSGCD